MREALEALAPQPAQTETDKALDRALRECVESRAKIPLEQAKLRVLIDNAEDDLVRKYLEYKHDLVALQLNRAADCAEERLEHLAALDTPEKREDEMARCAADTVYWFRWYAWSQDPRPDAPLSITPFDPFPFQEDSILWTDELVFEKRTDGVIEKSRDMGATWEKVDWAVKHWLFRDHFSVLFGSINEDKIDKAGELDTIFEKARFQLRLTPSWMLPKDFDIRKHCTFMHIGNPANGSLLVGEAPTQNFGRSGRYTAILLDELAFWPFLGKPQWTSCSQSSNSKIVFSSVNGKRTKQYELRQSKTIELLTLHWRRHPWKDARWYESLRRSMKSHEIAQEIDMDYTASVTGLLLTEYDEFVHIITRSEFIEMFGAAARDHLGNFRLPARGYIGVAQDVGTTDDHPNSTIHVWRPQETMPYSGDVFCYRESVFPEYPEPSGVPMSVGRIAAYLYEKEKPWNERERIRTRLMSHEGASERDTYQFDVPVEHRLTWSVCQYGERDGLSQFQNYLAVDRTKPHPVRKYPDGRPVMGRSRFYIVVADGQGEIFEKDGRYFVTDPLDADGFARLRAEIPTYALPKNTAGEEQKRVKPLFNDCVDAVRMLAAEFFPPLEGSTIEEKAIAALAAKGTLLTDAVLAQIDDGAQSVAVLSHMQNLQRELQQAESDFGPIFNFRLRSVDQ